METAVAFIRDFLVPGSISFFVLGLGVGLVLVYREGAAAKWGRRWLTLLVGAYWFLSTPLTTDLLAAGLDRGYGSLTSTSEAADANALVVLSGGSLTYRANGQEINTLSGASAFRTLEAARVYHLLDAPWVVVSGGIGDPRGQLSPESEAMRAELIRAGVPAERILLEPASQNTYEQAINAAVLLDDHDIERFVLVTSPSHMWRALATFEAQGLHPIPSVSASHSEGLPETRWRLMPRTSALLGSRGEMREYLALAYYWSRGWLRDAE